MLGRMKLKARLRRVKKKKERLEREISDWSYVAPWTHPESLELVPRRRVAEMLHRQLASVEEEISDLEEQLQRT
jgi:predicted RNase H-like nuclease (RuvC/YqgF family)